MSQTGLPLTLPEIGEAASEALRRRDASTAARLLEHLVTLSPGDVGAWHGLAMAREGLGDVPGKLAALDRALAIQPRHLLALMMKADHYARAGDARAAQTFYKAVVTRAPPLETLPPAVREEVRRAARESAAHARRFESHLLATMAGAGYREGAVRRVDQALDLLLGRKQLFTQAPSSFYFPELPQRQFFEREEFPWLAALEARTGQIREELDALLRSEEGFEPYVRTDEKRPIVEFGNLRDNPDWGAAFLIRSGRPNPDVAARCPRTMAALEEVPLSEAHGRIPSVLFSRLRPRTHIPPHNGQINARLICHLPLITPPDCGLRVGNETREWVYGRTLIFDDTIEHEAWNHSDQVRVVLLFEVWRPELSTAERALISALLSAVGDYDGDSPD